MGLLTCWSQRIPGLVIPIDVLQGSFMAVIVPSIRQGWRFVNHDLGMVRRLEGRSVAAEDSAKETLHGFHLLL